MSGGHVLFHLLERLEVHAAEPAAVPQKEGRFGVFGVDCGMLFHQVHLLMFDKVATVRTLPPGWVLVKLPVGPQVFRTGALRATLRTCVMVPILLGWSVHR